MPLAHARIWTLCFLLVATTACDVVIEAGETVSLGSRTARFGSMNPNAVFVRQEGTLVVEDADLFGRGVVVDTLPLGRFPTPGAGVIATGGRVEIRNGFITGGNVLVRLGDPNALPPVSSIPGPNVLAPALNASDSDVFISGGLLTSSSVAGDSLDPYIPAPALVAGSSFVVIDGGSFQVGSGGQNLGLAPSIRVARSFIQIGGGSFAGIAQIESSGATIAGGSFSIGLALGTTEPRVISAGPGCTEIRGGSFGFGIDVRGQDETVFIFGNDFDRGFGPLPIQTTGGAQQFMVTGTRLDDTPLNLPVFAGAGTRVVLASPDDSGCGFF